MNILKNEVFYYLLQEGIHFFDIQHIFSPRAQHVVIGGGQDARDVTTTSTKDGKFEARFFHLLMEEEFGRIKGHFGPINTLAFHPDGRTRFNLHL